MTPVLVLLLAILSPSIKGILDQETEITGVELYHVSELLSCWLLIKEKLILKCAVQGKEFVS